MSDTTKIGEFDRLMEGVMAGSQDAIWDLAETYTPYIVRAAQASLPANLRAKVDVQDFAQSLWASLLLKRKDLTLLQSSQQLVAFLAKATRNKVIDKTRHYRTQKHDIAREESLANYLKVAQPDAIPRSLHSRDPSPSTAASLKERWQLVLSHLSERDRTILQLRLQGRTFGAISTELRIDEATARRTIKNLIAQLAK